ncbi:glutathione peroxidase [Paraflavitalea soli]|uniref:Glutathione peroxidase n=1 Tax=Paraflavitalea soli TaxID=2315862 RepID=A0A3B7MJP7_9BACT|nr:glutathione peroxidase [Paraflavitalea soli]AXY74408.1 glutathione peroxidase [Paraflavitalea soli]
MNLWLYITHLILFAGIYDFTIPSATGDVININDYRGKKILIVNIATSSHFASQLGNLETLYQRHKDSLTIIAIPSNSFTKEPLSDQQIQETLKNKYHTHYLVAAKSTVSGYTQLPLYKWLTQIENNGVVNNPVNADFQKFLINKKGAIVGIFSSTTDPLAKELENAIINN